MKVRVKENHWIARVLRVGGITLYPYIFLAREADEVILNHEFIHVRQVRQKGWFRFYVGYLADYFKLLLIHKNHFNSYMNIPFEVEAYRQERVEKHPVLKRVGRHLREI